MCNKAYARSGSALVITLGALVLISAILLVFFNLGTMNRQISFSSAGQSRADVVAQTAIDTTIGDLRDEIVAGSTPSAVSGITNYIPINNSMLVPAQVNAQTFPNLVKQSTSAAGFWGATPYTLTAPVRAGTVSTKTPSLNGHYVSINRWNKPGLLSDPGSGATPLAPTTAPAYVPPDWILVIRKGAIRTPSTDTPSTTDMTNSAPATVKYPVGRYAYAIYDEGGLLDANVAGFPPTTPTLRNTSFSTKRGLLSQVDLQNIPGMGSANADAICQWRNAGTTGTSDRFYTNYVFNATNGLASVAVSGFTFLGNNGSLLSVSNPGDQAFLGRQDLINFVVHHGNSSAIPSSALQYLGTFSRELNAPSHAPTTTGNPSLIDTRVVSSFTRASDKTTAAPGEPLIKYRFPLSRLSWIGYTGPAGFTSAGVVPTSQEILDAFGLSYGGGVWVYSHGNPAGTIMSLSDVATAKREPDFFELLQAAILQGSLGKSATNASATLGISEGTAAAQAAQIIQIGANLIDQYDADSYPTRISFNGTEYDGVENLPYLSRVFATVYRPPGTPRTQIGMWYQPEIWNPHCQVPGAPASVGPTLFRVVASGTATAIYGTAATTPPSGITSASDVSGTIEFSATSLATPTLLSGTAITATSGSAAANTSIPGFSFGLATAPDSLITPAESGAAAYRYAWDEKTGAGVSFGLQYKDQSGTWVPPNSYSKMSQLTGSVETDDTGPPPSPPPHPDGFTTYWPRAYFVHVDPRTDRFGGIQGGSAGLTQSLPDSYDTADPTGQNATIRVDAGNGDSQTGISGTGWTVGSTTYAGLLSQNTTSGTTHYADPDGIVRPADGAYASALGNGGYPLATDTLNNPSSRPVILNRPFQSVGEMGYAFRDEPWKSIDFFTSTSADAALLDLFCVNTPLYTSATASSTAALPEAGRLDLNTRQPTVLKAVLTGALTSEDGTATISSTDAQNLAVNLVALTTGSPLLDRSELVTRWLPQARTSIGSTTDATIKRRMEASIQALADVGTTRTWNLLIDVIAQSGRYTAASGGDFSKFMVEGERRYWVHVAIDRFTGKVVARQVEPVSE